MARFPRMADIIQKFDAPRVDNIPQAVVDQLKTLNLQNVIQSGQTVAVTAGSRGIANIAIILRATVDYLKSLNAVPFIVPAMGSHGGGTVEGQLDVLRGFGVTEESLDVEIRATMDTVVVAQTDGGIPVHFDRHAHDADHVLVVNRIKPHTRFVGEIESGLHKMLLIGLGKHHGAKIYHAAILTHSFSEIIASVAAQVLRSCGVVGGLAILENAEDETAMLEAVLPENFGAREPDLLKQACRWLPTLPFSDVDLLIVDRIGKNISGTGMDANVIGRKFHDHRATDEDIARCLRIMVRSLTEETHGNATGIGIAQFTTERCVAQVDPVKTRVNCITANHVEVAAIPITLPTDAEAVECALQTIGLVEPENARVIQIADTLQMTRTRVSEAYFPLVEQSPTLTFASDPYEFPVDANGLLSDIPGAH